jgi:hypothetical protein
VLIEEYLSDLLEMYGAKDNLKVAQVCLIKAERFLKENDCEEA